MGMLGVASIHSLLMYKEDRHAFQQQIVGWIEEAFISIEASLASKVDGKTAEMASLTARADELKPALVTAEETQIRLREAMQDAQVKQSDAEAKASDAESTLATAKKASEDGDATSDAVVAKKTEY